MIFKNLRYYFALIGISLRASISLRWVFIARMSFMALNNFVWLVSWFVFYQRYPSVNGWTSDYFFIMYGTLAIAVGSAGIFGNGAMRLTRMIDNGALDTFLLQPKPILLSVLGDRIEPSGFGDIATGLFLYGWFGMFQPENVLPAIIVIFSTTLFMMSFFLFIQNIGFWMRNMQAWTWQLFECFLVLGSKPYPAFTGAIKIVTFTIIPCAFVSFFPVEYLMKHRWENLAASLLGTICFGALSITLFHYGLRRYESGNRFGVRA